jgi:hypothetical protein
MTLSAVTRRPQPAAALSRPQCGASAKQVHGLPGLLLVGASISRPLRR